MSRISAREFLALFRLTRVQFDVLLQTISQHPALLSQQSLRKKKVPAANQLLVFLNFFGSHQTLSQVALRFKIGLGSVGNYVNNITVALRALAPVLIAWPDEQERQLLKDYYKRHYFWDNVVGAVDGSCVPLSYCPSICGGDYFDRYFITKSLAFSFTNVFIFRHSL
jgi:hypothetical protein